MKKLLLTGIVIFILIFAGILFRTQDLPLAKQLQSAKSHTINFYDDGGYKPQEIKIRKQDTVVFKNNSKKYFWPASDIHPTHGIYPEFDPQDTAAPGQFWSFRFGKAGTWRFHDHISPYFTGRITVE